MSVTGSVTTKDVLRAFVAERPVIVDARGARAVTLVNDLGEPTGTSDTAALMCGLLERERVATEVQGGTKKRPRAITCRGCHRPFATPEKLTGKVRTVCQPCFAAALGAACGDCGSPLPNRSNGQVVRRASSHRPWRCFECTRAAKKSVDHACCNCGIVVEYKRAWLLSKNGRRIECPTCSAERRKKRPCVPMQCFQCGAGLSTSVSAVRERGRRFRMGKVGFLCRPCASKVAAHGQTLKRACPRGHEYTESNTLRSGGSRTCRECSREDCRRRRALKRQVEHR